MEVLHMTPDDRSPQQQLPARSPRRSLWLVSVVLIAVGLGIWLGLHFASSRSNASAGSAAGAARVVADSPVQAGKYVVMIGGCNDCHTAGFMERGLDVPESDWLTGVPIGWRGPWGTTYASNLRLSVTLLDEDMWVKVMRQRNARPPMAWTSLHAMAEDDLHAVYKYLKSLGAKGEMMPLAVPPNEEPKTPFLSMEPLQPKAAR
jgi:hypothetical protein